MEGGGRGVVAQERRRDLAAEVPDIAGELGEAEVDEPVELAYPVAAVLDQSIAEPHELAQLLGGPIRQAAGTGRRRAGEQTQELLIPLGTLGNGRSP